MENMQNQFSKESEKNTKKMSMKSFGAIFLIVIFIGLLIWTIPKIKKDGSNKSGEAISKEVINKTKEGAEKSCKSVNESAKNECIRGYYVEEAARTGNEGLCDFLKDNADQETICLNGVYRSESTVRSDISFCEKISQDDLKTSCKDQYYQDLMDKDPSKGSEYCAKLSTEDSQKHCLNVSFYNLAEKISSNDMEQAKNYCGKIINDDRLKGFCLDNIKVRR